MGAMPDYAVKVLIFGMTFSILLGFTCTVLAPYIPGLSGVSVVTVNSFQTFPNIVFGATVQSVNVNLTVTYTDTINKTYYNGFQDFNKTNLNNQQYQSAYGDWSHSWNYSKMYVWAPWWGGWAWSTMRCNLTSNYNYSKDYLNTTDIISHWDAVNNWTEVYFRNDPTYNSTTWDCTIFYQDWNLTRNDITQAMQHDGKFRMTLDLGLTSTTSTDTTPLPGGQIFNPDGTWYFNVPAISSGGWFGLDAITSVLADIFYIFLYVFMVIGWFVTQVAIFLQILLAPLQIAATLGVGGFILVAVPLAVIDSATIFCFVLFIRSLIPT